MYKLSSSCMRLCLSISTATMRKSYDIYVVQVTWFRLSLDIQWPSSSCSGNNTWPKPEALHRNVNKEKRLKFLIALNTCELHDMPKSRIISFKLSCINKRGHLRGHISSGCYTICIFIQLYL